MEPWQNWTIVGIVGAGAYWYYAHSQKPTRGRNQKTTVISQAQRRSSTARDESKGKQKKGKGKSAVGGDQNTSEVADISSASAVTSGNEKTKKRKGGKTQPSKLGQSSAVDVGPTQEVEAASNELEVETIDNEEFANQMLGLKSGTNLKKSDPSGDTKKTRKQGKQNESRQAPSDGKAVEPTGGARSHEMSQTSSTTGADADDDLSPAVSPALGAFHTTPDASGVADMLEAPAKGPSVLRLIQSTEPQPERQQKPKKAAPEPETKKQRRNRQKNEERKAAREQAEKERRVLMEKQRRIAREAEGRPAKNGLGSMPPTTNAWSKPTEAAAPISSSAVKSPSVNGLLLDTFEESSKSVATFSATGTNGSAANQKTWERDIPSEEEQMRMLSEMDDDGWNTVEKGGKAKKKNAEPAINTGNKPSASDDTANDNGFINSNAPAERKRPSTINVGKSKAKGPPSPMFGLVPPKSKTTKDQVDPKIWNRDNIHDHPDYDPEYPYALTGHPEDSDWAVV